MSQAETMEMEGLQDLRQDLTVEELRRWIELSIKKEREDETRVLGVDWYEVM